MNVVCPASIHDLKNQLDDIVDKNYLTHNIHPYPAKFIPQIPTCIIESYSTQGNTVLDPFCGSGTTLLEAALKNRKAIGLDLNPIATLISKVKTNPISNIEEKIVYRMLDTLDSIITKMELNPNWLKKIINNDDLPKFYNINHWFQKNVIRELFLITKIIEDHIGNSNVYDFLRLCLSAIIVKVSNQESDTRWVAKDKNLADTYTIKLYTKKIKENLEKLRSFKLAIKGESPQVVVINDDVIEISNHIRPNSVDLIITSPPYLNSYDYYLYHKLRMFWLGYDYRKVQKREIGSRNRHCDDQESIEVFFQYMGSVLKNLYDLLRKNAICAFIVGDSIYRGDLIKMDTRYEIMMSKSNLSLEDKVSFNQRKYSKSFTPNLKKSYKESHILLYKKKL